MSPTYDEQGDAPELGPTESNTELPLQTGPLQHPSESINNSPDDSEEVMPQPVRGYFSYTRNLWERGPMTTQLFVFHLTVGGIIYSALLSTTIIFFLLAASTTRIILGYFLAIVPYRHFTVDFPLLLGILKAGIAGCATIGVMIALCTFVVLLLDVLVASLRVPPVPGERGQPNTSWKWVRRLLGYLFILTASTGMVPLGVVALRYTLGPDSDDPRVADEILYGIVAGITGQVVLKIRSWVKNRNKPAGGEVALGTEQSPGSIKDDILQIV